MAAIKKIKLPRVTTTYDILDANAVHRTGDEEINGKKTFKNSPLVPTPTVDSGATPKSYVDSLIAGVADAMLFKGTLGQAKDGATVTALPANHKVGWTYKVVTAGTYAGMACEVGDMIACIKTRTTANNADWTVFQGNIDGAVTGPTSSTDAHVAIFNGATGKVIKDSGFTIGKSVPADAKFTDTQLTESEIAAMGFTKNTGTITGIKMNGSSKGTSGVIDLGTVITAHQNISGKLDKITYEYNKELALGSNGLVCLGKFPCYDSNVTIDLDSTTNTQYHGTIILATQNINTSGGGTHSIKVYGDANNTLTPNVKYSYNSGSNVISIYAALSGWSKNLAHVRAVALSGAPTDILTSISAIPSDATKTATNALAVVARTNNYNDLTNKPTIPTLTDSTSTTSSTVAASATAVKAAYDHYPSVATPSAAGLMSATDKTKVDNLRRIFYGTSTPSGAIAGDFWFDTN